MGEQPTWRARLIAVLIPSFAVEAGVAHFSSE